MKTSQSRRLFLGILTVTIMIAGTGLTIVNHWSTKSVQLAVIAVALSAAFFACEIVFIWTHKEYEKAIAEKPPKRWRKMTLFITGGVLFVSMSLAFYVELMAVFDKQAFSMLSDMVGDVQDKGLSAARGRNERSNVTKTALSTVTEQFEKHKGNITVWPFVLCYVIAGLGSFVILGAGVREKEKRARSGNIVHAVPGLLAEAQAIAQARGIDPSTVMAYKQTGTTGGEGFPVHARGLGYIGFVPASKLPVEQKQP